MLVVFQDCRRPPEYEYDHIVFQDSVANVEKKVEEAYFLFNKIPDGDFGKNCIFDDLDSILIINSKRTVKVDYRTILKLGSFSLPDYLTHEEWLKLIRTMLYLNKNHINAIVSNNTLGTIWFSYREELSSGRPEDDRTIVFIKYDSLEIYPNWPAEEYKQLDRKGYFILYKLMEGHRQSKY